MEQLTIEELTLMKVMLKSRLDRVTQQYQNSKGNHWDDLISETTKLQDKLQRMIDQDMLACSTKV